MIGTPRIDEWFLYIFYFLFSIFHFSFSNGRLARYAMTNNRFANKK